MSSSLVNTFTCIVTRLCVVETVHVDVWNTSPPDTQIYHKLTYLVYNIL